MTSQIVYMPIDDIPGDPKNPKAHDLDRLDASMRQFGIIEPVVIDERTGLLISGHGRKEALIRRRDNGQPPPAGVIVDETGRWAAPVVHGWSSIDDVHAEAALIALNRIGEAGGWEDKALLDLLTHITEESPDLAYVTGFDDEATAELHRLIEEAEAAEADDENRAPTTGELLTIADVTWGEPEHSTHHGQTWMVGPHTLVVAKVADEHHLWRHLLTDDTLLCPYPEPYLTCGTIAQSRPLLLVQPNVFLAGHLLDKHASTHPDDTVALRP
jgi:hypothetical protein